MTSEFTIEQVTWQDAEDDLRHVRETVFMKEQFVPASLEWDGLDEGCVHVIAYDGDENAIGTARLQEDGTIGRMAVLKEWRNKGIGSALLQRLMQIARERGQEEITLGAQLQAMNFYKEHGFVAEGATFMDANIPHRLMRRNLSDIALPAVESEPRSSIDLNRCKLGENTGPIHLSTREDNRTAAQRLVEQGERSLHLLTRNLDPVLFDTEPFIDAVRRIAIASPRTKVYILLQDPTEVVMRGHRIVELARRISSHIFINRACEDDQARTDSFLIVDQMGLLYRPHGSRYEGTVDFHAPGQCRQLLKTFEDAWERSQPEPELRRLHI